MNYFDTIEDYNSFSIENTHLFNLWELKNFLYGAPFSAKNSFEKISNLEPIKKINSKMHAKYFEDNNTVSSGVRLRFKTNSEYLSIKAHLKSKYAKHKTLLTNSSGFDIYQILPNNKYIHLTVVAPDEPFNLFAHTIKVIPNYPIEIYFPSYNVVLDFSIAITLDSTLLPCPGYTFEWKIIFYGNSITQGASASRSGNAFPNIVSRSLDADIVNYSFSGACKAEKVMAEIISSIDYMAALVIDYSRNANSYKEFSERYPEFYSIIRKRHQNIPIILIGDFFEKNYDRFIKDFFLQKKKEHENIFYINLTHLFEDINRIFLSMDNIHYTDIGMYRVANKIVEYLKGSNI